METPYNLHQKVNTNFELQQFYDFYDIFMILGTYSVFGPFRGAALVTGILATMTEEFFGIISSSFVYAVKL